MDTITITPDWTDVDADTFIAWAIQQPDCEHYELHDGVIVRMPNETSLHGLAKALVARRLGNVIEEAGRRADVYVDAIVVQISGNTVFEPDIVVRSGERLPPRAVKVTDPLIAVEVLSESSRISDFRRKQSGYVTVQSLMHYLAVDPEERTITHYRRCADGSFETLTHGDEPLTLDPPGITIDRLFP